MKRSEWLQNKDETCDTDGCEERRFECRKAKGANNKVYPRAYFIYFGVKKAIFCHRTLPGNFLPYVHNQMLESGATYGAAN